MSNMLVILKTKMCPFLVAPSFLPSIHPLIHAYIYFIIDSSHVYQTLLLQTLCRVLDERQM